MARRVELHTHTTASDGVYDPAELAALCEEHGVEVWALTDHDTCLGCEEARRAAERRGIAFVSGIEISAWDEEAIHVLGYGTDPASEAIDAFQERMAEARRERMAKMVSDLRDRGIEIEFDAVAERAGEASLSRAHLARALVDGGAAETIDDAFDSLIGTDSPVYRPVTWPSVEEAVAIIERADGAAVVAHPGRYDSDHRIEAWAEAGIVGLEVAHPSHDADDERRYREAAERLELLATESCDFHGGDYPEDSEFGTTEVDEGVVRALLDAAR